MKTFSKNKLFTWKKLGFRNLFNFQRWCYLSFLYQKHRNKSSRPFCMFSWTFIFEWIFQFYFIFLKKGLALKLGNTYCNKLKSR